MGHLTFLTAPGDFGLIKSVAIMAGICSVGLPWWC